MNTRVRSIVTGAAAGIVPLLLLELARILVDAHERDGGATSLWWPIACYIAIGAIVAAAVTAGARDRLMPAVAAGVVIVIVLPTVPSPVAELVPTLPVVPSTFVQQVVAFAVVGAYAFAAIGGRGRGRRR
ncbi:MAG: hypothetical protein WD011_00430 [Nitriliruptoraceae bacterium]